MPGCGAWSPHQRPRHHAPEAHGPDVADGVAEAGRL